MPATAPNRRAPKDVKVVAKRLATGKRKEYWYFRGAGGLVPIKAEPWSEDAQFELQKLRAQEDRAGQAAAKAVSRTFARLWEAYSASPDFTGNAERTRRDYQKVRDWMGAAAEAARPATMTGGQVRALRDRAFRQHGRRFANYVVQVLRLVLEWGRPDGWLRGNPEDNPARKVPLLPKPKGEPDQNRAWSDNEVRNFIAHAPPWLLIPFAIGLFTAMREGDMVRLTWRAYDGQTLRWIARKNGEKCVAPVSGLLKELLDAADKTAVQICIHSKGAPWKDENSFRGGFFDVIRALQGKGLLGPNTTFHGLRHTVAVDLRETNQGDFHVASALGDRSMAMAQIYGRDARRQAAQMAALTAVQERLRNKFLETSLETDRKAAQSDR